MSRAARKATGVSSGPSYGAPHDASTSQRRQNVLESFHRDHENIQSEFEGFQTAGGDDRYFLANRLMRDLEVHARLEADVLYPALQAQAERRAHRKGIALVRAVWKEHQMVQAHLARVKNSRAHDDAFTSQIDGLMQRVQGYAEMEERELFPLAQALLGEAGLVRLLRELHARREELDHHLAA